MPSNSRRRNDIIYKVAEQLFALYYSLLTFFSFDYLTLAAPAFFFAISSFSKRSFSSYSSRHFWNFAISSSLSKNSVMIGSYIRTIFKISCSGLGNGNGIRHRMVKAQTRHMSFILLKKTGFHDIILSFRRVVLAREDLKYSRRYGIMGAVRNSTDGKLCCQQKKKGNEKR